MDLLIAVGFWWLLLPLVAIMMMDAFLPDNTPDLPPRQRPKLAGEDLITWTQLYQAHMRVGQSQLFTTEQDVHNWTWQRWHELTGKPQWVEGKKKK